MNAFGLVPAAFFTLIGTVIILALLGAQVAFRIADRRRLDRPAFWPWAMLCTATLLCLIAAPLLAIARAGASTGWVDENGDGTLDGTSGMGSLDWFNVSGGTAARWWLTELVVIALAFGVGAWLLARTRHSPVWDRARSVSEVVLIDDPQ